jgi:hypothetical protein
VLFVSTPVTFPVLDELEEHLQKQDDKEGRKLLNSLVQQAPIKPNPNGVPSLWYIPLVGGNNFFDGFGFADYRKKFSWSEGPADKHEKTYPPKRPLLKFLENLNNNLPKKWSTHEKKFVQDDNWLLLEANR